MEKKYYLLNGAETAESEISLSIIRRGFYYGDGIFETLMAREGRIFRWEEHWSRLQRGARVCNLELGMEGCRAKKKIERMLQKYSLRDAYFRISVWRKSPETFDPGEERLSNMLVFARPHAPYPERLYEKGITCAISRQYCRNEKSSVAYIKSLNYIESINARMEAKKSGCADSLLLNTAGHLACASAANLFFVKSGTVFTPSPECGILSGVTRNIVCGICKKLDIKIMEGFFVPDLLREADEVFLTNTLMGILPVGEIKGFFKGGGFSMQGIFRAELEGLLGKG